MCMATSSASGDALYNRATQRHPPLDAEVGGGRGPQGWFTRGLLREDATDGQVRDGDCRALAC